MSKVDVFLMLCCVSAFFAGVVVAVTTLPCLTNGAPHSSCPAPQQHPLSGGRLAQLHLCELIELQCVRRVLSCDRLEAGIQLSIRCRP